MNLISVLISFVIVVNATESLVPPTLQSQGDWLTQFKENVKNAAIIKNLNDSYVAPVRCLKEILHIFAAAARTEMWALRVIDSWGKFQSGILMGNFYELGNFDECMNSMSDDGKFEPKYCLAQFTIQFPEGNVGIALGRHQREQLLTRFQHFQGMNRMFPAIDASSIGLNVGVCVPDMCDSRLVEILLGSRILNFTKIGTVKVKSEMCQINEQTRFGTADIISISIFAGIIAIILYSTIFEIIFATSTKATNDRNTPSALQVFSLYSNGKKLFKCHKPKSSSSDVMHCLNGIRVLSIVWVVFGHAYMFLAVSPIINTVSLLEWIKNPYSMMLISAPVSVDSFFVLSGLLVTWSIMKHLDSHTGKLNIAWLYFHRYIRLTPSLAAAMLLCSTLLRHIGTGPLWNTFMNMADKPCQKWWWSALLYVQNYVNPTEMCLSHSWYLSVDMQLYVLSPLLVYPLWRWKNKFIGIVVLLTLLSMAATFAIFWINNFGSRLISTTLRSHRMELTYYPTHTRMCAWLVGVAAGYTMHQFKDRRCKVSKIVSYIGWPLSMAVMLAVIFGNYPLQQLDHTVSLMEDAIYASFSRVAWSTALAWQIFMCTQGYGGPINWFLSMAGWQPFARLSYAVYIVHFPVQLTLVATSRTAGFFSDLIAINQFWSSLGITLCVAVIWTLAFESPILVMEKMLLTKKLRPVPPPPPPATVQLQGPF